MMKIWIKNVLLGWLSLLATTLTIGQTIDQAEYFINEDPGTGNGTALTIATGSSLDESFTFTTEGLEVGNHTLYVRTKEAGDRWSLIRAIPFYVQDTVKDVAFIEERLIVAAEYFVDTEPGAGQGTDIPVATSGLVDESLTLNTEGLSPGEHKLYVRTQDDSGVWSLVDQMDLFIQDTVKFVPKVENKFIVAAEYFIDTARAVGQGVAIPVTVGGEVSQDFTIQTAGLSNGEHKLYVRTQGNDGVWSLYTSMDFAVLPTEANLPLPLFTADTVDIGELMSFVNLSDSVDTNTTYKWDVFDDGIVDFNTTDITYTFDTTGLIPVRLTAFNGSDSSSYMDKVLIGSFTNLAITASGSTDLCEGEEVMFTAPDNYSSYAWNTGDSTQSITAAESGNYFAWLTDNNGFTIKSAIVSANVTEAFSASIQVHSATTGQSNGFAKVIVDSDDLDFTWSTGATETFYVNQLPLGSYSVTVSKGQCSEIIPFNISDVTPLSTDLVKAEYFFDSDPGIGLATSLNISSGQEVDFASGIPTTGLTLGNHKLFVRTMDNEGLWSIVSQMSIFIKDTEADMPVVENRLIVGAEYFINSDPGVGSGMAISVPAPVASISDVLNIETSSLSTGVHTLYVRTQDDQGIWSQTSQMEFRNCNTVVDAPLTNDVVVCPEENLMLTATGALDHTFIWYRADFTVIENQTSDTYSVGQIDNDMVFYVAQKDLDGCQSTLTEIQVTAPQFDVFAGLDGEISKAGVDYDLISFYPVDGVWSGTGISTQGAINRANIGVGEISYTYTVDTLNCSFSDSKVMTVLDLSETYDLNLEENQFSGTLLQQVISDNIQSYEIISGETTAISTDEVGQVFIADSAYFDFEINPNPSWTILANQNLEFTYNVDLNVSLSDVQEAPVIVDQTYAITENSLVGTVVGSILATDQDSQNLTFTIDSGNESGVFLIQNENQLTIDNSSLLDFETNDTFVLVISVDDGALSSFANVMVNVSDINESPILAAQIFSINENSANGTAIGAIVASDPENDVLTYSITAGNTNNAFAIDASSGALKVADVAQLDFETTPTFTLTVQVEDAALNASADITINLNDVDESVNQAPHIIDQTFSISENSANGTSIGTVDASDPDNDVLTYSIISGNTNTAFAIDGSTGLLSVSNVSELDLETNPSFSLAVQVEDAELNASATITVNLVDVDESVNQAPQIIEQTFNIDENSANGTIVGTVIGTDPDGDAINYQIISGNGDGGFVIDQNSGVLSVSNPAIMDFEINPSFDIVVEVSDGQLQGSATITINLNDIDESVNQAPQIVDQTFSVDENSANGTQVGTVVASDSDNDVLTYSITAGNTNNAFGIDASSGALTVADVLQLDFETTPTFILTIQVEDAALNASADITINLNDIDELVNQAPQIVDQTFSVDENSANGTSVGVVVASDPDNDVLTYSIAAGNTNNAFGIDASSGALTIADVLQLDFETTPTFTLTVQVDDAALNASADIIINLNDVVENQNNAPEISDQSFTVIENSDAGTIVGTVIATDPDNDVLSYGITAGNSDNAFAISAGSGELLVVNSSALNRTTNPSFNITVSVTDGVDEITAFITVSVEEAMVTGIGDLNDQSIVVYPNPATSFISVSNLNGSLIDQIKLIDNTGKAHVVDPNRMERIDVSKLNSGLYYLLIQERNGKSNQIRFMKR